MFKKYFLLAMCLLLLVASVVAQDVPDEIDDFDDDWEEVIDQLADDDYIDADSGELVLEERRIRFDEDEDIFVSFDTNDLTDFVMGVSLQIEPDGDEFEFCMVTFRDTVDDGFLMSGLSSFETVNLYDVIFDEDEDYSPLIAFEEHGEDVDEEIHVIIVALDEEITVYADGELIIEEDDLSVREGVLGLLRTENTGCEADDLWIWEIEDDGSRTSNTSRGGEDDEDDNNSSSSSDFPDEIDNFDGASEDVIDTLVDEGVLGSGNAFLFGEDYAFIGASGSSFVSLGRNRNRTDVVMAGEITFDSQSSNYEQCGLLLRVDDALEPVQDFLFIGLDSEGDVFIQNNSDREDDTYFVVPADVDLDDGQHFVILARGEAVTIYLNGELIIADYPAYEVRGIFGIAQISDSTSSECEGRNIWVYDTPFFEEGVCNVIATGNVNLREEASTSTSVAGTLSSGETMEVEAQTEPGDGFVWYELENGAFVREDVIDIVGDCSDLPES